MPKSKKAPVSPLRQARLAMNLSLRDIEDITGVPRSVLSRIETGANMPNRPHARALWECFEGKVSYQAIVDPDFCIKHNI